MPADYVGHVLVTVGSRMGVGEAVYTRPYSLTLYEYVTLMESDSIEGVRKWGERVEVASLNSYAFHSGELLAREYDRLADAAGTLPSRDEALAEADLIAERLRQFEPRGGA